MSLWEIPSFPRISIYHRFPSLNSSRTHTHTHSPQFPKEIAPGANPKWRDNIVNPNLKKLNGFSLPATPQEISIRWFIIAVENNTKHNFHVYPTHNAARGWSKWAEEASWTLSTLLFLWTISNVKFGNGQMSFLFAFHHQTLDIPPTIFSNLF